MAKKDRFPPGYSATFAPHYESEGSGSSGHIDSTEDSSAPMRKWVDLNSASRDGFAVPIQTIPLSKLSTFERKNLVLRLTSELEQIRLLQSKVESRKEKRVSAITKSSSSDILSCNNSQRKGAQLGNLKKPAALGPGPGKKGGRAWSRGITGRFESVANHARHENANAGLLKQCESLLKKLMSQQYAWVFNTPVDVVKLNIPDYYDIIKNPMDLGTIKGKLSSGKYSSPLDFLADVRLTFSNAKTYNPPGTDVHVIADTMSKFFELRWKAIEKKLVVNTTSQSMPERSAIPEETEIAKPLAPAKKRKLSPVQHEVLQEPIKPKMTEEEKQKLGTELENLLVDLPDSIIEFLKAQTSNGGNGGEDEIEIDIDDLSDETLFTLRKLLDEHLKDKEKNLAKSEACEIELPNVSGLSNSSLQIDKGNNPMDEDVDIGGNEAPVTSNPPDLVGKDAGGRAEEYNEAGPDSDGGSECSKDLSPAKQLQDDVDQTISDKDQDKDDLVNGHEPISGSSQPDQISQQKSHSSDGDGLLDGESAQTERQVSPDKLYRAALLKNRFADTILKAREKTLGQDEKTDPERLRREREELENLKKREKARLQAEARAAEDARRQAEAEAAAEAKRRRELEREAAREKLLKMEKTVEINENSRFLEDLEMLSASAPEQLPCYVEDDISPDESQDGFGSFKFRGSNPLEQLGLYMKEDEDEEEVEPPAAAPPLSLLSGEPDNDNDNDNNKATEDVEEGEID
ncbi:transcription factor GTE8-like isoform X2 [Andrographis paniculata]|uniref:transcription factor GTE8-like isoform X2 n=1 Tax=Andrographis paniculata TaxID=175694 RepID=UPI0021E77D2E|nr:transcription factor GTE8-like isoform X2 [Andrographis paniculata]